MANRAEYFTCPCCGMKAPIERLTEEGPYDFEMFLQEYGGKRPFTPQERAERRGQRSGRGSGVGIMSWTPIRTRAEHRKAIDKRLREVKG